MRLQGKCNNCCTHALTRAVSRPVQAVSRGRITAAALPSSSADPGAGDPYRAFAVSLLACSFALQAAAPAAASETTWKPRRHHRGIGERFSDTWADAIVEVRQLGQLDGFLPACTTGCSQQLQHQRVGATAAVHPTPAVDSRRAWSRGRSRLPTVQHTAVGLHHDWLRKHNECFECKSRPRHEGGVCSSRPLTQPLSCLMLCHAAEGGGDSRRDPGTAAPAADRKEESRCESPLMAAPQRMGRLAHGSGCSNANSTSSSCMAGIFCALCSSSQNKKQKCRMLYRVLPPAPIGTTHRACHLRADAVPDAPAAVGDAPAG